MQFSSPDIANEFKRFWHRHEENNRHLWSCRVTSLFARGYVEGHAIDNEMPVKEFLREHLKGGWRKNINLKHYKGPYVEGTSERPELLLKHLLADQQNISEGLLYQSVVVNEIRALELLFDGVFESIASYVLRSETTKIEAKQAIGKTLERIKGNERYTVSMKELSSLLPTLGALLDGSTYKREPMPFLSTKINGISCTDAVSMWKEVRNLIIHHDRLVTAGFSNRWSGIFLGILGDSAILTRKISPGSQLTITLRQAIFCLTTCHQSAATLYVALGQPTVPAQPIIPPDAAR